MLPGSSRNEEAGVIPARSRHCIRLLGFVRLCREPDLLRVRH